MLIQDYQKKWAFDFQTIKAVLLEALSGVPVGIEHVGSTSVPGLAAKPIIDIDMVFKRREDFEEIKAKLETLGYFHNGDQGIPDREVFKRRKSGPQHDILDDIQHHLYVCAADSEELYKHLTFRNFLLNNAGARREYAGLKMAIAAEAGQDRKLYAKLKEEKARGFIHSCLERAEREPF